MEIQERKVLKRDGRVVPFSVVKIREAINKAVTGSGNEISHGRLLEISRRVGTKLSAADVDDPISVEVIQDMVELTLQEEGLYAIAKHYILYRDGRQRIREQYQSLSDRLSDKSIVGVVETALTSGPANGYDISKLSSKFETFYKPSLTPDEELDLLAKAAAELTSKEEPHWEYVAGNIVVYKIDERVKSNWADLSPTAAFGYPHRVKALVEYKLYGEYLLDAYTPEELNIAYHFITPARDRLFTYSGIDLIEKRYLTRGHDGRLLETPQEMFLGIALHLHKDEDRDKRMQYVKEHYDVMSQLKLTMATPTMSNARKPFHQLSSCFIETVEDSLDGIYRATTNFAEVSKHGGGMGMFFGHVRATGGSIRGFEGAAGGVIPWIKLANDTAVAVDQLGVRQGAVAVYLDVWHKDLPEFLQLRTNNGDDRKKAHDVFPAVSYPDYFWYLAEHDRGADWHMFDPKEVKDKMGFYLEDSFGKEWEDNYKACVAEPKLSRRTLKVKDVIRLIITSLVETGTPFTFNRDTANRMNPNKHAGNIYSSNLCTEIFMNQSPSQRVQRTSKDGVVTEVIKSGDFPVCNLASLVLGNIDLDSPTELEHVVSVAIRALDNVITHNYYPTPFAKISNDKYRAVGLGASGYHHALAQRGIFYSSQAHLEYMDEVFENINYYAIKASMKLANEKGKYPAFKGSDWDNGDYFTLRGYNSDRWKKLSAEVHENGLRNGWLLAVAPTGSTSVIAGTSAGVDPIMNRYFLEEKKGSIVPRVAPGLDDKTFWVYENAHEVNQIWTVRASGVRQRHIDQGQSVNMYITTDMKMSEILNLMIEANKVGMKSIYYFRSKSLEVEECDTCSA